MKNKMSQLFNPSCSIKHGRNKQTGLLFSDFYPLLIGYVIPTVVIGYFFLIPGSAIAGINELTIGFTGSIIGAVVTYWYGLKNTVQRVAEPE